MRGFTLLEVVIAMAILAMALAALVGHEGIAIQMSAYSNRMSQAALLARAKMLDIEHRLHKDSMDALDVCDEGDFRDEGFRRFKWKACGYPLELAEGAGDQMVEQFMSLFSGMGMSIPGGGGGIGQGGGNAMDKMGRVQGQMMMLLGMLPTFLQQLEDKLRKVRVEVTWKQLPHDKESRMVTLERFVTSLGADVKGAAPEKDGVGALRDEVDEALGISPKQNMQRAIQDAQKHLGGGR